MEKTIEERLKDLEQDVQFLMEKRITQVDVLPRAIKQRHLEANIIFFGLSTDRPDGSTEVQCWFSTDNNTLSIWNGTAWVSEVLS